jgi:2-succinyl-5-enolpyruvyl-6-hydroxy-3-cyclohexene-1-carboxylate synthase
MYSNSKQILHLLSLMKAFNISKVVISPGSRHFPITHSLEADSFFKLYSVVDERSAAFFALGLIQKTNEPVAICCSSGTASINYGSAICEAFYQRLPLLVLTTDRIPELLGQMEDQMIKQDDVFKGFVKYQGQLPTVATEIDEWYCNRIINEAFIALDQHGRGPVHLNIPILAHHTDTFQTLKLPDVRKITFNAADLAETKWNLLANRLTDKNVMIVWGQSVPLSKELADPLDRFCEKFNCVILTDKISNFHHSHAIENAFIVLHALGEKDKIELAPDVVISIGANYLFNNELKAYLKPHAHKFENWFVGKEDSVCDPFWRLVELFSMHEATFLNNIVQNTASTSSATDYFDKWKDISGQIEEPNVEYSELYAIGKLIKSLPQNVGLQLANSSSIRMGNLFDFDKSIRCFCNRGVNGIDGCMSTAVGYAANSDEPVFLVIGDLTFFYDMNALWNRQLSPNLRILLINNEGGAVMHSPFPPEMGKTLAKYTSAGHSTSVKGWVESLGFKYMAASNKEEVDNAVDILTSSSLNGPAIIEVFTEKVEDVVILKQYYRSVSRVTLTEKVQRKAGRIVAKFLNN